MIHIARKITATVVVVLLACTPMATAFAASPNGHNASIMDQQKGNNGQKNGNGASQSQNSDNQKGPAFSGNAQKDKDNENANSQSDNKNMKLSDFPQNNSNKGNELNIAAIQASIAAVSDPDTKASLTALLAAYQAALDTLQQGKQANADSLKEAKDALLTALSSASIKPATIKGNGALNKAGQNSHGQLSITALQAAINGISNEGVKSSLQALFTAYQTALDALKNAQGSNADAAAIKTARDSLNAAQSNFLRALYSAGVKISTVLGSDDEDSTHQTPAEQLDIVAIKTDINALNVDQSAKDSLLALADAYQTALATLKSDLTNKADATTITADMDAITAAKSTLLTALSAAGIKTSPDPGDQDQNTGDQLDIEAIKTAINALSVDQPAKDSLLALVDAYQTALGTLNSDQTGNAAADTVTADRNAVDSAKAALLSALSNANIALPSASPSAAPSATATTQVQTQQQTPGDLWSAIVNWFAGIFGQK